MKVDNETFFSMVEEQLAAGQRVRMPLVGRSMEPTLLEDDILTVEPLEAAPQVGDVVLFRYHGRHLLHRVVAAEGDRYTMRGDNSLSFEEVSRRDIVAKLTAVEKRHKLRHVAVRWLGGKGRRQLRPWYFLALAILMWAPLNGLGVPLDNYLLGLRLDHLLHASVFIPCPLFLWDLYGIKVRKRAVWATAVGVGLLTECVQWLLPYRGFDINDMVANFLGVSLGWLFIVLFQQGARRQRQCPGRVRHGGCR